MSMATIEVQPRAESVRFEEERLVMGLQDGRVVAVPLAWYPRLQAATEAEREQWTVLEDVEGRDIVFWEGVDELVPVVALLTGVPSRESEPSFQRWLAKRNNEK